MIGQQEVSIVFDVDGVLVDVMSGQALRRTMSLLLWLNREYQIRPIIWTLNDRTRVDDAIASISQAGYSQIAIWLESAAVFHQENMPVKPRNFKMPSRVGARIIVDDDEELAGPVARDGGIFVNAHMMDAESDMDWLARMRQSLIGAIHQVREG